MIDVNEGENEERGRKQNVDWKYQPERNVANVVVFHVMRTFHVIMDISFSS